MVAIVLALAFATLYRVKYHPNGNHYFFNTENSKAMRGFWCIVVILVHVPAQYKNTIQNLIGSFAYIGVTYFFLTSAFGLSLKTEKSPDSIKTFWRTRLPKLLIPQFLINIFVNTINILWLKKDFVIWKIVAINPWVQRLLICYAVFWLASILIKNKTAKYIVILTSVAVVSVLSFYLKLKNPSLDTWHTEMCGFLWGILLFLFFDSFKSFSRSKWLHKSMCVCFLALCFGVLYLKFKYVLFFGDYLLRIVLGLCITVYVLFLNTRFSIGNKFICFLGDISFEVYLLHGFVFRMIDYCSPSIGSGVYIILAIFITVILSGLIHLIAVKLNTLLFKISFFKGKKMK